MFEWFEKLYDFTFLNWAWLVSPMVSYLIPSLKYVKNIQQGMFAFNSLNTLYPRIYSVLLIP